MPSVRGRQRFMVAAALLGSAAGAGGLAGLVFGILLSPVRYTLGGQLSLSATIAVIVGGLALDAVNLASGRAAPLAVGRQVPQEWTRLLDPSVVAALFGARLGIGPLTILSTWLWWSVTVASALVGLVPAVAVGAMFGLVRLGSTVAVSLAMEHRDQAVWFGRLRARRRPGWVTLNALGLLVAASALAVGCSTSDLDAAPSRQSQTNEANASASASANRLAASEPLSTTPTTPSTIDAADESAASDEAQPSPQPPMTTPAQLEDFVREAAANPEVTEASPESASSTATPARATSSEPEVLAEVLVSDLDGFDAIEEPEADRFLDLDAAAAIQPDPTEEISLLETRGYRGGWTRAFRNESNDVAVTSVYHFEDEAQAEFYLEDGLITIGGYGGSFFDIEGQPGVRGFAQSFTENDEELISLGAAFQIGHRWFLTYIVGSPESVTPDMLIPVVADQRQAQLALVGASSD